MLSEGTMGEKVGVKFGLQADFAVNRFVSYEVHTGEYTSSRQEERRRERELKKVKLLCNAHMSLKKRILPLFYKCIII